MELVFDRTNLTTARAAMHDDFSIELQRSKGCSLDMRYRPWHTISFYLGEVQVKRAGAAPSTDRLQPARHLAIYPAGDAEQIRWNGQFEAIHLHIAPHALATGQGRTLRPQRCDPLEDVYLESIMAALYEECRGTSIRSRSQVESLVGKVARHLESNCVATENRLAIGTSPFNSIVAKMLAPGSTELALDDLARGAGVSDSYFSRRFSAVFGCSPYDYLINTRVELAKNRIFEGVSSLADIALETGFYDQAHLTRQFRRRTGMTPGRYRQHFGR